MEGSVAPAMAQVKGQGKKHSFNVSVLVSEHF